VRHRVPDYEAEYQRRGWKMFPSIGRVYVNERARKELAWKPRYDFNCILNRLRADETLRSPLAQIIGSKGAVWTLHPANGAEVRVVVPTSQIFLGVNDSFGTKKFNAWHQKNIYEYKRRDAADSFELPKPLFEFFVQQISKYAGASDSTLQEIRYLREGIFLKYWTAEEAARDALRRRNDRSSGPPEDLAAFQNFADDMRSQTH
jgi:hypothetical protein